MSSLPEAFVRRMSSQLGSETAAFLHAMEEEPNRGIRMNRMKPFEGMDFYLCGERVPWAEDGYYLSRESLAGLTAFHEAGAFYLQEPSAMLPAEVMDVRPGERILDLCAAPGGKSTQIGLKLKGRGLLICNEPVLKRAKILSQNIERIGIPNCIVCSSFPAELPYSWNEVFDGVLVDAPCSGEGMFRRDPQTRAEWSPEQAEGCSKRQTDILREAARLVQPGGRLVYSTCTYNPRENEETVEFFLKEHPEYSLEPFQLPGAEGKDGTLLCLPNRMKGEGQFVALLRKKGEKKSPKLRIPFDPIQKEEKDLLNCQLPGIQEPNRKFGNALIQIQECPDLNKVKILRAGLKVAEWNGKTVIPDHAAALCIIKGEMPEEELDEKQVRKYLSGEEITGNSKGWVLLKYKGLILGWAKGSGGKLKNHYPKGLRKQNILTETI